MLLDEPFRGLDALDKGADVGPYCARLFEESGRTNLFVTTDIDEAVFLADRILIMANVPTRLRAVLEVDLPRPRKLADVAASRSRQRHQGRGALSLLHEEAMKSFAGGSKAAADFPPRGVRDPAQPALTAAPAGSPPRRGDQKGM